MALRLRSTDQGSCTLSILTCLHRVCGLHQCISTAQGLSVTFPVQSPSLRLLRTGFQLAAFEPDPVTGSLELTSKKKDTERRNLIYFFKRRPRPPVTVLNNSDPQKAVASGQRTARRPAGVSQRPPLAPPPLPPPRGNNTKGSSLWSLASSSGLSWQPGACSGTKASSSLW